MRFFRLRDAATSVNPVLGPYKLSPEFLLLNNHFQKHFFMKPCFINVSCLDETIDGLAVINANNISSLRRLNYNDTVQTIVLMMGGEKFGVTQTPDEIIALIIKQGS
jgi:hypothetical protein